MQHSSGSLGRQQSQYHVACSTNQLGSPCLMSANIGCMEGSAADQGMAMVLSLVVEEVVVEEGEDGEEGEFFLLPGCDNTPSWDQTADSWGSHDNVPHRPSSCSTRWLGSLCQTCRLRIAGRLQVGQEELVAVEEAREA